LCNSKSFKEHNALNNRGSVSCLLFDLIVMRRLAHIGRHGFVLVSETKNLTSVFPIVKIIVYIAAIYTSSTKVG
jgi:hypothetical protein